MNISLSDIKKEWITILIGLLLTGCGAIALLITEHQAKTVNKEKIAAKSTLQKASYKLTQLQQDDLQIRHETTQIADWISRGVIGPEERLDWAELINQLSHRHQLPMPQYDIDPQRILTSPSEQMPIYASQMKLKTFFWHEDDMLLFLHELKREAPAIIRARSCSISLADDQKASVALPDASATKNPNKPLPRLYAECVIDWITTPAQLTTD